jgi:hypothetical protein
MKSTRFQFVFFSVIFLCAIFYPEITNCQKNSVFTYDLTRPSKKWILPKELKEISGQVWLDRNHVLAIEDLHPILYSIKLGTNATIEKQTDFKKVSDKKMDIEDVALVKNTVYALWSHGVLYKIKDWQGEPDTKKLETPLSKENNTEGLCYDPVSHDLLIACKNESDVSDQKKSTRSVFEFDLKADSLISELTKNWSSSLRLLLCTPSLMMFIFYLQEKRSAWLYMVTKGN